MSSLRLRIARRLRPLRRPTIVGVRMSRPITDPIREHWTPPSEIAERLWRTVKIP